MLVFMQDFRNQPLFRAPAVDGKFTTVVCVEGCVSVGLLLDRFCELHETVLTLAARCMCARLVECIGLQPVVSLCFTTSQRKRTTQSDFPTASEQKHKNQKNNGKHVAGKARRVKAMPLG